MAKELRAAKVLSADYMRMVAEQWPKMQHAQDIIDHLPQEVKLMLQGQPNDFLRGFANAITLVHDLGVKPLIHEMVARTSGVASEPRDVLLTKVGSVVEGCGYLACEEYVARVDKEKD